MKLFKLHSSYKPIDDQKKAIDALCMGIEKDLKYQVLLGVTGSGKTFTIANIIERLQRPALIISHNKTLAGQLYQEFRDYFPGNAVSYFVSYYDYYQPEAYIPSTDTYIEKDAQINDLIDKLRLSATTNLLTRKDTIVISSVSCIYNLGSPTEYGSFVFEFTTGMKVERNQIIKRLINLQYERGEFGFHRGTFRVRGNIIDIYPAYQDTGIRIVLGLDKIDGILEIDPVSGSVIDNKKPGFSNTFTLYPAKHFITDPIKQKDKLAEIEKDMKQRFDELTSRGKILEAHRLKQKVSYDLSMIKELGYVKGIENYSRYFDGRSEGDPPYSLLEYYNLPFNKDWLLFVDESHMTFPQIRGMYNGDFSRKQTLIDYGFRLPSALDNRPLKFDEFLRKIPNFIATSATPSDWELSMAKEESAKANIKNSKNGVVEQLVRPTGIPDPTVEVRPVENQVSDVIEEIIKETKLKRRTLVTTLTKKTAEDLSAFLKEKGLLVQYLHSDVDTLERTDILDDLRSGKYDCLIGVNLLREGLDLPEVSLVAILDADKEGFLRSEVSLVQTMGRAARHVDGRVILYADRITNSIKNAISEVERRRKLQIKYNKKHNITPRSIIKPIREKIVEEERESELNSLFQDNQKIYEALTDIEEESFTPMDKKKLVIILKREMKIAASDLNFELATKIRDKIRGLES
jgi:excinuclease ABC subunit B